MKHPVPDTKQDVSSDVPGVNRRNIQTAPTDSMNSKERKDVALKDKKGNRDSKTMIDGAEGETF